MSWVGTGNREECAPRSPWRSPYHVTTVVRFCSAVWRWSTVLDTFSLTRIVPAEIQITGNKLRESGRRWDQNENQFKNQIHQCRSKDARIFNGIYGVKTVDNFVCLISVRQPRGSAEVDTCPVPFFINSWFINGLVQKYILSFLKDIEHATNVWHHWLEPHSESDLGSVCWDIECSFCPFRHSLHRVPAVILFYSTELTWWRDDVLG